MYRKISIAVLMGALSPRAHSQVEAAESLVVTATRNPLPTSELGASVIVLQRADIDASAAKTVSEILRGLPGLTIRRSGGAGSNAEIMIRGDKGGHTLVLVDGIEQADVTSIEKNFDIGDMPLEDVERIEIIKGAHSVAYGGSGLSGVIHVITRRPQAGVSSNVGLQVGSYGTYGSHVRVSGRQGDFGYAASVRGTTTDGYSHAGSRERNEADGFKRTDERLRLQYGGPYSYGADLVVTGSQSQSDIDAGANADDQNYQVKNRSFGTQLTQKIRWNETLETRLTAAQSQTDRRYFDDLDAGNPDRDQTWERSRFEGERRTVDLSQVVQCSADQRWIASAQWIRDSAEISGNASYQGFDVNSDLPQQLAKEFSYALQYQWGLWDRVYGQWGVRTLNHSSFGKKTVGQAALTFLLAPDWTNLRLNYGRGFKTPSLYQLRAPIYGNEELQPESVISVEVSLEQKIGPGLSATVTGFQSQTESLIDFDSNASRYYNINRARIKGVESKLSWEATKTVSTQAQYTHLSSLDKETNRPLPSRPDDSWGADVTWKLGSFSWLTAIRGQSQSRGQPFVEGTEGFKVVDTALAWHEGPTRLNFKVNNFLNSWYQEIAGYNTAGRNYQLAGEFSF